MLCQNMLKTQANEKAIWLAVSDRSLLKMLIILTNQHLFGAHLFDEFVEMFFLTGFEPDKTVSHILLIGEEIVFACFAKADLIFHCWPGLVTEIIPVIPVYLSNLLRITISW